MEIAWALSALKTAAAGFSVAGGLHLVRRTPAVQRIVIRQTLQGRAKEICDRALIGTQPRETSRRLATILSSPSAVAPLCAAASQFDRAHPPAPCYPDTAAPE